ncbi:beta-lactamase family protein [Parvularcula sp. ZS-1/3]|uniref:Beta-lactamase family protein n=1 Tax=Parvularcula mediterranea TaxID=2732508 RepID=A0A7Y3RP48_9PROT|nr:serine hydrolase domain-containing protein [Parvularcula mediterranea]NNU17699.1 beta-lactamase family protein [Parvularcula mediterranea]
MRTVLASALFAVLAACASTPADPTTEELRLAEADVYFTALTSLDQFNGTVVLLRRGETIHLAAHEMSGDLPPTMAVDLSSQFDLRSVSKLLAKVAVVQLTADGVLTPETRVSEFYPDFPNGDRITVRHLMDNASGLPRELTNPPTDQMSLSRDEIIALAATEALAFEPGTDTRYSNVGYHLLYSIIGEASGLGFERYVEERIFAPAGMERSGAHFFGGRKNLDTYAYGHTVDDDGIEPILEFQPDEQRPAKLYSTAEDLGRLIRFLSSEPYASVLEKDGVIAHAGGTDGKRAYVEAGVAAGYGFAFLTNYDAIPFAQLVADTRAMLKGEPYEIPAPVMRTATDLPEEIMRRYVGTYRFEEIENLELEIRFEQGGLALYQNGELGGRLKAESEFVFFEAPQSKESITFRPRTDGRYDMLLDWQGVTWEGTPL